MRSSFFVQELLENVAQGFHESNSTEHRRPIRVFTSEKTSWSLEGPRILRQMRKVVEDGGTPINLIVWEANQHFTLWALVQGDFFYYILFEVNSLGGPGCQYSGVPSQKEWGIPPRETVLGVWRHNTGHQPPMGNLDCGLFLMRYGLSILNVSHVLAIPLLKDADLRSESHISQSSISQSPFSIFDLHSSCAISLPRGISQTSASN